METRVSVVCPRTGEMAETIIETREEFDVLEAIGYEVQLTLPFLSSSTSAQRRKENAIADKVGL